jgi:hypothetical protein
MTIEHSLRRRATQARCLSILWLSLAVAILIGTYVSLPSVAAKTIIFASQLKEASPTSTVAAVVGNLEPGRLLQANIFSLGTLLLGLSAVSFACFLLGRSAYVEIEIAARCIGLADALCIAGDDFERLQKAADLFVPKAKYFSTPEMFSPKDRESFVEILKLLRKS